MDANEALFELEYNYGDTDAVREAGDVLRAEIEGLTISNRELRADYLRECDNVELLQHELERQMTRLNTTVNDYEGLRECCRVAIKAGDWQVDGAADPDCWLSE